MNDNIHTEIVGLMEQRKELLGKIMRHNFMYRKSMETLAEYNKQIAVIDARLHILNPQEDAVT